MERLHQARQVLLGWVFTVSHPFALATEVMCAVLTSGVGRLFPYTGNREAQSSPWPPVKLIDQVEFCRVSPFAVFAPFFLNKVFCGVDFVPM